ncbi:hypothetical protein BU26DRAFT_118820 [Trematosphaeria pertusa]|uniref:Uncharacterized protein n=1 Tax=Trematosphaeria pertusa TaxID=390896 RepID=A0A6A6HZ43_9PLEO|nr:uncharacterized protein BU26DRAFT_118820 [Trematosphaeria pertusa]KAF2243504.1 hypothetical protein BU26DRAFT_118820 [Trematosphaeria pertusa]
MAPDTSRPVRPEAPAQFNFMGIIFSNSADEERFFQAMLQNARSKRTLEERIEALKSNAERTKSGPHIAASTPRGLEFKLEAREEDPSQLARTTDNAEGLKQQIAGKNVRIQDLEREVMDVKRIEREKSTLVEELKNRVENLESTALSVSTDHSAEVDNLKKSLGKAVDACDGLKKDLEAGAQRSADLEGQNAALRKSLKDNENRVKLEIGQVKDREVQLERAGDELKDLKAKLEKEKAAHDSTRAELEGAVRKMDLSMEKLEAKKNELTLRSDELLKVKHELEKVQSERNGLQSSLVSTKQDLERKGHVAKEVAEKLSSAKARSTELETSLGATQDKLDEADSRIALLNTQLQTAGHELRSLKAQLKKSEQGSDKHTTTASDEEIYGNCVDLIELGMMAQQAAMDQLSSEALPDKKAMIQEIQAENLGSEELAKQLVEVEGRLNVTMQEVGQKNATIRTLETRIQKQEEQDNAIQKQFEADIPDAKTQKVVEFLEELSEKEPRLRTVIYMIKGNRAYVRYLEGIQNNERNRELHAKKLVAEISGLNDKIKDLEHALDAARGSEGVAEVTGVEEIRHLENALKCEKELSERLLLTLRNFAGEAHFEDDVTEDDFDSEIFQAKGGRTLALQNDVASSKMIAKLFAELAAVRKDYKTLETNNLNLASENDRLKQKIGDEEGPRCTRFDPFEDAHGNKKPSSCFCRFCADNSRGWHACARKVSKEWAGEEANMQKRAVRVLQENEDLVRRDRETHDRIAQLSRENEILLAQSMRLMAEASVYDNAWIDFVNRAVQTGEGQAQLITESQDLQCPQANVDSYQPGESNQGQETNDDDDMYGLNQEMLDEDEAAKLLHEQCVFMGDFMPYGQDLEKKKRREDEAKKKKEAEDKPKKEEEDRKRRKQEWADKEKKEEDMKETKETKADAPQKPTAELKVPDVIDEHTQTSTSESEGEKVFTSGSESRSPSSVSSVDVDGLVPPPVPTSPDPKPIPYEDELGRGEWIWNLITGKWHRCGLLDPRRSSPSRPSVLPPGLLERIEQRAATSEGAPPMHAGYGASPYSVSAYGANPNSGGPYSAGPSSLDRTGHEQLSPGISAAEAEESKIVEQTLNSQHAAVTQVEEENLIDLHDPPVNDGSEQTPAVGGAVMNAAAEAVVRPPPTPPTTPPKQPVTQNSGMLASKWAVASETPPEQTNVEQTTQPAPEAPNNLNIHGAAQGRQSEFAATHQFRAITNTLNANVQLPASNIRSTAPADTRPDPTPLGALLEPRELPSIAKKKEVYRGPSGLGGSKYATGTDNQQAPLKNDIKKAAGGIPFGGNTRESQTPEATGALGQRPSNFQPHGGRARGGHNYPSRNGDPARRNETDNARNNRGPGGSYHNGRSGSGGRGGWVNKGGYRGKKGHGRPRGEPQH